MRIRVATFAELPEGKGRAVDVDGHSVALFRVGPSVYALRNRCSHAGAPLSIGHLRGRELTCAWHGWVFDVTTGESIPSNPPFDVPSYPLTIAGGEVYVEVPHAERS